MGLVCFPQRNTCPGVPEGGMSTYTQRNHNNVLASELTLGEGPLIGHQVLPDHYKLLFLIVITALFPLLLSVREQNHLIS